MSRSETILVGADVPFAEVAGGFARALGVEAEDADGGRLFYPVTETGGAWLDREPADVMPLAPPEWRDALIDVEIRDEFEDDDTDATQVATARKVFDALVRATPWKVVLIVDDATAAIRERVTSAA
jgi:hypothetical protein